MIDNEEVKTVDVNFNGMNPQNNPPIRITVDELIYLLEKDLVEIKGKKVRTVVLAELGSRYVTSIGGKRK